MTFDLNMMSNLSMPLYILHSPRRRECEPHTDLTFSHYRALKADFETIFVNDRKASMWTILRSTIHKQFGDD